MSGELIIIENQMRAIRPRLEAALAGIMPVTRLEQTILVSCERTPDVALCTPQSVMNAAMTFAVLGLPVDGATGQGFLLPFKDKKQQQRRLAQAVIGYKGYNTLGARAGLTITAGTVREGDDEWDYREGSGAFVRHRRRLNNGARIVAFWACAEANDRPCVVSILSLDDVLAIRAKSRAANADGGPWHDERIGFPAMGEKSARRRLARSLPLVFTAPQFQLAARMEEALDEQGKLAWITPDKGVVVEGQAAASSDVLPSRNTETPTAGDLTRGQTVSESPLEGYPHLEGYLKEAASKGIASLQTAWANMTPAEQRLWEKMKDLHFKPMAIAADKRALEESQHEA